MNDRPVTIFLSAAEASGDEHGAKLMDALRDRYPNVRFVGVGGAKMEAGGCELLADLTKKASMLGGPILRLGYYIRLLRRLKRAIKDIKPDLHIPIDSPALNWHLAAASKSAGVPVMYYIAPQVWAWAPWRVKKLARLTDHVACILPFEQRYFRDRGVRATYVGHPLFDEIPPLDGPLPDLAEAWSEGTFHVALLPGSRPSEIKGHIPALLQCAKAIRRRWSRAVCTITAYDDTGAQHIMDACRGHLPQYVEIVVGKTRHILQQVHFAVAASGTVTLEVAYYGVPMVVFYRVGQLGYSLVKPFVGMQTPHLSLVNILAGRRVVPELMPWFGRLRNVSDMVMDLMQDYGCLWETRQSLIDISHSLRVPPPQSASGNAADIAAKLIEERQTGDITANSPQ